MGRKACRNLEPADIGSGNFSRRHNIEHNREDTRVITGHWIGSAGPVFLIWSSKADKETGKFFRIPYRSFWKKQKKRYSIKTVMLLSALISFVIPYRSKWRIWTRTKLNIFWMSWNTVRMIQNWSMVSLFRDVILLRCGSSFTKGRQVNKGIKRAWFWI